MEAKVVDLLPLRNLDGAAIDHWIVIGQVVAVYIDRRYLTKRWALQHRSRAAYPAGGLPWKLLGNSPRDDVRIG
jgi:flavin reductase (DIM6/NTAB) family NADH-FMN oxidoreductase RutF